MTTTKDDSSCPVFEHDEGQRALTGNAIGDLAAPEGVATVPLEEEVYHTTARTYLVLLSIGLTWGTCTLANVGPSSTYSHTIAELGGQPQSSWIPNAALFPLIGLQPIWGAFADRFGKRGFICAGGLVGVIGNVVAATAKSTNTVIGGQALNGIGSSLFLLAIPASMEIVTAKNRSFAQGATGLMNGVMAIVGLISSGCFAKMSVAGWRWVYYFNAIFFGISAIAMLVLYRPPPTKLRRGHSAMQVIQSVDYIGCLLLLLGVIGVVTSLTWGGDAYPWDSAHVLALLIVGVASFLSFGFYEGYGRRDGLIDHRFLESRNFLLILSVAFIDGMLLYGVNVFLAVEEAAIFTSDAVKVNVYLLPLNVLVLVGIAGSAVIFGKTTNYRTILSASVFVVSLFCGLLALVTPSRLALCLVFTGLVGLGVGVTTVIPLVVLTYAVPSHLIGTAGTVLASTRALGGTIGITIFSSIYSNQMSKNLPPALVSAALNAGLPTTSVESFVTALLESDTAALANITGATASVITTAEAEVAIVSAQSFRYVWIANMAIGLITFILCLFLQPVSDKMTAHIESALEDGALRQKQLQHEENVRKEIEIA